MLVDDVTARIEAQIPDLAKRTQGAAELATLVRQKALPNETPFAFVIPLGLSGGEADATTGLFRQNITETIAVLLLAEAAGDETGAIALPTIDGLIDAVIAAIAGWSPAAAFGVFALQRGALLSVNDGTLIYQLDFTLSDQLRI